MEEKILIIIHKLDNKIISLDKAHRLLLDLFGVRHWVGVSEPPKHGQEVLTYTPSSDISEETQRLLTYGTLMNGLPSGVTHWMVKPKPPCA